MVYQGKNKGFATLGLRGPSGPAGGADFFGFACQNQRFPNDFCDQTISQGLGAGGAPNFRDFKAFELSLPLVAL